MAEKCVTIDYISTTGIKSQVSTFDTGIFGKVCYLMMKNSVYKIGANLYDRNGFAPVLYRYPLSTVYNLEDNRLKI